VKFIDKHFNKIITLIVFVLGVTIAWAWIQYKDKEFAEGKLKATEQFLNAPASAAKQRQQD